MSEICDKVEKHLMENGFTLSETDGNFIYTGVMLFPELSGQLSDGIRYVTISICPRGRYIGHLDGWGNMVKDIDMREYWNKEATDVLADLFK